MKLPPNEYTGPIISSNRGSEGFQRERILSNAAGWPAAEKSLDPYGRASKI